MSNNQKNRMPVTYNEPNTNASNLILDNDSMNSMMKVAELMAKSHVQIPDHLKNKVGDCFGIVMVAMQWRMNPFMVAQGTYYQRGKIGYEAKLINAVAMSTGVLREEPEYQFYGDWSKILGNIIEKKGDKGKYYVANWDKKDEIGLGVTISAKIGRFGGLRKMSVNLNQCWPRFSTQWATDPQQQISYAAITKLIKRYAPGALLGVNTEDDLPGEYREIDITPEPTQPPPEQPEKKQPYPEETFLSNLPQWDRLIATGTNTPMDIVNAISRNFELSQSQIERIKKLNVTDIPPEEMEKMDTDNNPAGKTANK